MPQPSRKVERICEWCHAPYTTKPSVEARFCCWNCLQQYRATLKATTTCPTCGTEFVYRVNAPQKYCSMSCAITARNLTDANPSYHRDISGPNNPMYGKHENRGPKNPMYGVRKEVCRKVRKDGYVLVRAPEGHPYPADHSSGTSYILEHRLVMEQALGRYLLPTEIVHHIDGNPSNNAIENLRLCSSQTEHLKQEHPEFGQARHIAKLKRIAA